MPTPDAPVPASHSGAPGSFFGEPVDIANLPTFPQSFERAARTWPDLVAVEDATGSISYAELERRSAAIARSIAAAGPKDEPFAMLAELSVDGVVGFVGALRSGRPVVVLDRVVPVPKLRTILELAGATSCFCDDRNLPLGEELLTDVTTFDRAEAAADPASPLPAPVVADPALVLFTSGSTGTPKGVVWDHRMLVAEAVDESMAQGSGPGDRVIMPFPMSFVLGSKQVSLNVQRGTTLLIADPRQLGTTGFYEWVRDRHATVLAATPSMLRSLIGIIPKGEVLHDLTLVIGTGEPLQSTDVHGVRRFLPPQAAVLNDYGSSEAAIVAMLRMNSDDDVPEGSIPAGYPSPWRALRVVGEDGSELPDGETGELVVTTPVSALGYWRDPERSAQKFRPREDGLTDVVMGDLAEIGLDGMLRIKGRSEASVKIRGYLVDPNEIEAALLASGRVKEVVVVASAESGVTRLIAYFVPALGSSAASVGTLRGYLLSRLPTWMVPAHFVPLQELPRTERGKVDRMGLPPVPLRRIDEPATDIEARIAAIWADVLGLDEVGRNEDFFELGGDSLGAEEVLARVQRDLGVKLVSSDFLRATALKDLADLVAGGLPKGAPSAWPGIEVQLREGTSGVSVFCIAGGGASALSFSALASLVAAEHGIVVFQGRGLERWAPAEWSIPAMVRRRVAMVKRLQPSGPQILVGHSLGALLALGMARQLSADGHDVTALLIDPFFIESAVGGDARRSYPELLAGDRPPGLLRGAKWYLTALARLPQAALAGMLPKRVTPTMLPFMQSTLIVRSYQPTPWAGRVYGYRSTGNPDPPELWTRLMPNAVVRDLPSTHLSMLQSPYIEAVVADIEAVLAE